MGNVRLLFGLMRGAFGGVPAIQIDLSMAKSDSPDPVNTGDPLVYTLTVTNLDATETANNVQVVDTLPAGVTFVSAVGTGWVCLEAAGTVTCDRATAGPGAAPVITVTVTAPVSAGPITNTAVVSADEFDPNLANNTAMETTTVQDPPIVPATGVVNYSVGTAVGDIGNGGTVTFASGAATFSLNQPNAVGIGDEIDYAGGLKAYISQRVSASVMAVTDAVGDFPPDVVGATVNSIARSFASIKSANDFSLDASHLNTADLTTAGTAGVILQWPCWDDGILDDGLISIAAYTTDATHFLRIFAPFDTSTDVAVSQRHTGIAGTGFRMQFIGTPAGNELTFFNLDTPTQHIRLEGLELDGSASTMVRQIFLIHIGNNAGMPNATSDVRIDGCLIHDMVNDGAVAGGDGRMRVIFLRNGNLKISNCFMYHAEQNNSDAGSDTLGIRINSGTGTIALFNNTIFDFENTTATTAAVRGYSQTGSQTSIQCRNCVGMNFAGAGNLQTFSGTFSTATNNVSSDAQASSVATAAPNADNQTSFATYFVSDTLGSEDLHLLNTAMNLWGLDGVDLSADATLPVTEDIDLVTRVAPFDIGGDQF